MPWVAYVLGVPMLLLAVQRSFSPRVARGILAVGLTATGVLRASYPRRALCFAVAADSTMGAAACTTFAFEFFMLSIGTVLILLAGLIAREAAPRVEASIRKPLFNHADRLAIEVTLIAQALSLWLLSSEWMLNLATMSACVAICWVIVRSYARREP